MILTVCIEAGRSTLTHTSWTGPAPVSRKWMSGQAAALATQKNRTPFTNLTALLTLRDLTLPGAWRPPGDLRLLLTFTYHGCPWMSPN